MVAVGYWGRGAPWSVSGLPERMGVLGSRGLLGDGKPWGWHWATKCLETGMQTG